MEQHHVRLTRGVGACQRPRGAEPGVVDQERGLEAGYSVGHPGNAVLSAQIGGERLDPDAVPRRQHPGELLQATAIPGDDQQVVPSSGELLGELASDPGTRARDDRESALGHD
jgi:hypothetical protein